MSILKQTIDLLSKAHLLEGYEHFSINYVDRNAGWLSYQLHKDRDFGIETAINTLRYVRQLQTFYFNKRRVVGALVDENIEALKQVDGLIQKHLEDRYGITQIKQ